MKILVSSMTFTPDHSGISLYATDFAKYASENGHEVTVVSGFSFYPKWEKRPEDKGKLFRTDFWGSIKILRGYLYVPEKVSTLSRILQEISFLLFAFFNFLRAGKQDVIIVFTTPINLGVLGVIFQKLWRTKLVINIQDLQVDAAESLGMVGKSPVITLMKNLERFSYRHADIVSSISDGMINLVKGKEVPEEKILYWPNWIDVQEAERQGTPGNFRAKFPELRGKTIIGYAGNIGVKQGLSTLVDLASQFHDHPDVVFLIIGEGGDLPYLKTYAQKKGTKNIRFLPFMPQAEYYDFITDVDVVYLSQKKDSGDVYFPSKLLGIMAKAKITLIHADPESELFKVVNDHQVGLVSPFGDIDSLTATLTAYLQNPERFEQYKQHAHELVYRFDRTEVLKTVLSTIHYRLL